MEPEHNDNRKKGKGSKEGKKKTKKKRADEITPAGLLALEAGVERRDVPHPTPGVRGGRGGKSMSKPQISKFLSSLLLLCLALTAR